MSAGDNWIAQNDLLRTDYAMMALTSTVFVARLVAQIWRRKSLEWQDGWMYFSFAAYIAFTTCYVIITPIFFKLEELQRDPTDPANAWPTMAQDLALASQVMWSSGTMFWTCLWCVKFSLLALYKKLLVGLSSKWIWTYWGIIVFCALTYISCIITGPVISCNDTRAFWYEGKMCLARDEVTRQTANMYYAFAVDVLTNLLVMFLPLRLVMPLQMRRSRKIGVGVLFASGFVCILFSTIRIVQITSRDGKPKSPDPKWLTMWTIIECSTAVIIGCCPVLASVLPRRPSERISYDTQGYVRQNPSRSNESGQNNVNLQTLNSSDSKKKNPSTEVSWTDPCGSHENLPQTQGSTRPTRPTQEDEWKVPEQDERRTDPRNVRQLRKMR